MGAFHSEKWAVSLLFACLTNRCDWQSQIDCCKACTDKTPLAFLSFLWLAYYERCEALHITAFPKADKIDTSISALFTLQCSLIVVV